MVEKFPHNKFKRGDRIRIVTLGENDIRNKYLNLMGTIGNVNDYTGAYPYQVLIDGKKRTRDSDGFRFEQSELEFYRPRSIDKNGNLM